MTTDGSRPAAPSSAASDAKRVARKAARSAVALAAHSHHPQGRAAPDLPELRLKDLLDEVAAGGDLKRSDVREVLEQALTQIGAALGEGRDLSLPGLGKLKVKRSTRKGDRRVIEARLRQDLAPGTGEKTDP